MKRLIALFLLLSCALFAQQPGQLSPSIALKADGMQTYALYMPAHFDLSKKLPVVYVLDPGARGSLAASHFKAAADKFGFAIVASNVARNGAVDPQLKALSLMSADAEARFPLNGLRRYVVGFSGGARTAVVAGLVCPKCFAGIIGFGAGFPTAPKVTDIQFPYLAGVGTGDFNYPEVTGLASQLDKMKANYRILTYDGGHDWPSDDAIVEAFNWMQFQSIKAGQADKPADFPNGDYSARLASAQKLGTSNPQQAVREYDSIVRDFKGLHDTADAASAAASIRNSSDFKKAQKEEKSIADKATDLEGSFNGAVQMLLAAEGPANKQMPRAAAVRLINQMNQDAASKDHFQATVAKRAISSSFVSLQETSNNLKPKQTDEAVDLADLATLLRPDSPESFYWLAVAHTNAGHKKNAISALKKSIELGTPKSQVIADSRFKPLATESDFLALVQ